MKRIESSKLRSIINQKEVLTQLMDLAVSFRQTPGLEEATVYRRAMVRSDQN